VSGSQEALRRLENTELPRRTPNTIEVCRQEYGSSRGGVRNGETLIRLQEQIRASRGLPVSGGSQVDESIEIIQPCCQVFFQDNFSITMIPLEKQVCSLELAKRLKELGVKQESTF
jgi:hypothetical protein